MKRYIQYKSSFGLETVDELDSKDFKGLGDFYKELHRLTREYRLAYHTGTIYTSQRACKAWNE